MRRSTIFVLLVGALLLAACQPAPWGDDASNGNAGEGLLGKAFVRGNTADTMTNAFLGGTADDSDRRRALVAEQNAYTASLGQQVTWKNPQNGNSGVIVPVSDGYAANGAYCRDFQQSATLGGQQKQAQTKACQQPDASWKVIP